MQVSQDVPLSERTVVNFVLLASSPARNKASRAKKVSINFCESKNHCSVILLNSSLLWYKALFCHDVAAFMRKQANLNMTLSSPVGQALT